MFTLILKRKYVLAFLILFSTGCSNIPHAVAKDAPYTKPKFGPTKETPVATRLYKSHEYIQANAAPDFWALMPYYIPQQDERSCSVASVVMLVNAARASQDLTAADELSTQKSILKKINNPTWIQGVAEGGHGINLDDLGKVITESLKIYGFTKATVEVVHIDNISNDVKTKLHKLLIQNEKSANDFIIANFQQGTFTADSEGMVGHIAPVGAFDAKAKRVLIMDPDRQYYEPYWVSEEAFLSGMNTKDSNGTKMRGYAYIRLQ